MLWLERPPLLRWAAAAVLVAVALWSELSPPPTTTISVLVEDVAAGTPLEAHHVRSRQVPAGTVETVEPSGVAATDLHAGDPLVASLVTEVELAPGWIVIEAPIPETAHPGASATGIILDSDAAPVEFPALVVTAAGADPLDDSAGSLAVPPEWVASAAAAVARGELVVGVGVPSR